jgi:hypothetical protein
MVLVFEPERSLEGNRQQKNTIDAVDAGNTTNVNILNIR